MSAKILSEREREKERTEIETHTTVENKQEDGKRFETYEMNGKGKR